MEDNSTSVDQRWTLLHECYLQAVQLLAEQVRIECLAIGEQFIVDDSLSIPPNTQKNFPGRQSRLGHRLVRFTAFRPRPFAPYVVVSDPFFIGSHHTLQKCVDTVKDDFLHQFVWHPYFELLSDAKLLQMVYNGLMTHAQLLTDATSASMPVSFNQFSDFIAIFDDRPSGAWCIFDNLYTRTKTLKPLLCREMETTLGP